MEKVLEFLSKVDETLKGYHSWLVENINPTAFMIFKIALIVLAVLGIVYLFLKKPIFTIILILVLAGIILFFQFKPKPTKPDDGKTPEESALIMSTKLEIGGNYDVYFKQRN